MMDLDYSKKLIMRYLDYINEFQSIWTDQIGKQCFEKYREVGYHIYNSLERKEAIDAEIQEIKKFCDEINGTSNPPKVLKL